MNDCNKSIGLKADYTKAYYRRAVCLIGLNKYKEAFGDLLFILKDTPTNPEILDEISSLKEKWKAFLGKEEWIKIEKSNEEQIEVAKNSKNKSKIRPGIELDKSALDNHTTTNPQPIPTQQNDGFKKIKIVEETVEQTKKNANQEEVNIISPELSTNKIFNIIRI